MAGSICAVAVGHADDRFFEIVIIKSNGAKHRSVGRPLNASGDGVTTSITFFLKLFSQLAVLQFFALSTRRLSASHGIISRKRAPTCSIECSLASASSC